MIRPVNILIVEDSDSDAEMAIKILQGSRFVKKIDRVVDGELAMQYLTKQGEYSNAPRPDVIFLDLQLPKKSGMEVLKEVKASADYRSIPVIVLTASNAPDDIKNAYSSNANCCLMKPVNFTKLASMLHTVENFWLQLVALPPSHPLPNES